MTSASTFSHVLVFSEYSEETAVAYITYYYITISVRQTGKKIRSMTTRRRR